MLSFKPGDPVVYRVSKTSNNPGPRAECVYAAPNGESYSYQVDKFWVVRDVKANGRLLLKTRRGKEHTIDATDPRLRHARWWEKLFHRSRFPGAEEIAMSESTL